MRGFCLFCWLWIGVTIAVPAQALTGINEALEADEVVVEDETRITLLDVRNSRVERKYKVIIRNKESKDRRIVRLTYDKFSKISNLKVRTTDMSGKQIRKYGAKDCMDFSIAEGRLASDARVKLLEVNEGRCPYCVEVEYRIDYKESMFYPAWQPIGSEKQKILSATLVITDEQNIGFRHREYHISAPEKETLEKGIRYTWRLKDAGPVEAEPYVYNGEELLPVVFLGANDFEIDGYKGNMESWKNYGQWINDVCKGKNDLTAEDVAEVRNLCASLQEPMDKVKAVYRYVQQTTRYVSIQLGIGGWQPFSAHFVHEKKYGDCKALSFYTKCLLEAVGIPAYYTVIRAGEDASDVIPDFPMARFNHVIVTVPLPQDTLWLECTSNVSPAGYIGKFTSDRYGLLVDKEGGRLIRTRTYGTDENKRMTHATIRFTDKPGSVSLQLDKTFSGTEVEEDRLFFLLPKDDQEKKKWLMDHARYGSLVLQSFHFDSLRGDTVPSTGYHLKGEVKGLAQYSSGRYFFSPFAFNRLAIADLPERERKAPVYIRYPYIHSDTVVVYLPEGYQPEGKFPTRHIKTPYGSYQTQMEQRGDRLIFIRYLKLNGGVYPPSDYPNFRQFMLQVNQEDLIRAVLARR